LTIKVDKRSTREFDLHFDISGTDISHFVYEIPAELEVEFLPPEIIIENDFLSFQSSCELIDNKLNYH
ncbi:MAG TPA: hypothetical protein DDW62_06005, partial [Marinilabiliaceae bacterium]|nr:hypothetical protein [Marinilabiliaceae bacterium]